ncbi:dihydroorotate oxidase electron transfer subunit [Pseudonocardia acaciae]|uniref:iron-sulfur cluster-binding protein n=1 Tax=Pseudonocardia acaciae TaxID=551276 RepID=UPI00048C8A41|nr:dihydroorotate oxidase electron transfer subunit [Pseudonocardia acaciae]
MTITPLVASSPDRPRVTWCRAEVLVNSHRADRYRHLRLSAPDIAATARPGQFVMLTAARENTAGPLLPRPMAIYTRDADAGTIDVLYGVVGEGTRALSTFVPGERMVVVGPLGQGFVLDEGTRRVLLVGRGIGVCSLTTVAEYPVELLAVLSARNAAAVLGTDVFGRAMVVTDAEGTSGVDVLAARLCTELDRRPPQQILTCGSERLARMCAGLGARWGASVQVSLEAHMACGLGYCHGCAAPGDTGPSPLVCRDGPVFGLSAPA